MTTCGLCYKHITIVIDDSSAINKLGASLTDDARVIIYDCHLFIVKATDVCKLKETLIFKKIIYFKVQCSIVN